ncbi:MAG: dUTP diphosphatase [Candidatus Cloacimonadaceae bacterium]
METKQSFWKCWRIISRHATTDTMQIIHFKRLSATAQTPKRMTPHASGYDLAADIQSELIIPPLGRQCVPTGIAIALPVGMEAQVRSRSGLAARHGIGILNSPGTIDADYRGEIKVILFNASNEPFTVQPGMRIAQLVIAEVAQSELMESEDLEETERNSGGFGHTGY